jgi:hypothetical protein
MKAYTVAFTNGNGTPTKVMNISLMYTPKEAKAMVAHYRKDAKAQGHKNFGKKWDYVAVALTPVR